MREVSQALPRSSSSSGSRFVERMARATIDCTLQLTKELHFEDWSGKLVVVVGCEAGAGLADLRPCVSERA